MRSCRKRSTAWSSPFSAMTSRGSRSNTSAGALRQLRSESALPPHACTILTLQSSQLARAAEVFASAVERMERDLESVAAQVQDMAAGSRALMGISSDEQDSFFLRWRAVSQPF